MEMLNGMTWISILQKKRLLGRSLKDHYRFRADVDAVTMATMTSSLIFHNVNKLKEAFESLDLGLNPGDT